MCYELTDGFRGSRTACNRHIADVARKWREQKGHTARKLRHVCGKCSLTGRPVVDSDFAGYDLKRKGQVIKSIAFKGEVYL